MYLLDENDYNFKYTFENKKMTISVLQTCDNNDNK